MQRRDVTVGAKVDDFWAIRTGLAAGEKVVYEGLQRVRDGVPVQPITTEVQPKTSEDL